VQGKVAIQRYQYETSPRKLEEIYRQEKPKEDLDFLNGLFYLPSL